MTVLGKVESTNTIAKKLASERVPDGTAVIADTQTAGRGRMGRRFVSPSGTGIYMSIVIYPEFGLECAPLITSAAACAAAEAVDEVCGCSTDIKWVNDLYLNGRKICGILTEASLGLEMKSLDYAVIGIGINVRSVRNVFGAELGGIATSIEDETGIKADRNVLCGVLLNKLEKFLGKVKDRSFLDEYRRREFLTGNTITANVGGETLKGMAMGIDDNANLIVKLPDGKLKKLSSGEASLCRLDNR